MNTHWQILVVDDDPSTCELLAAWLREDGFGVDTALSGQEALEKARLKDYAIYFLDLKMPGMNGIETMRQVRRLDLEASVIVMAGQDSVNEAIAAVKEGARDYIVKPYNRDAVPLLVDRIVQVNSLQRENAILRTRLSRQYSVHDVITKNPRMQRVLELADEAASLRSPVLIQAESGTGKEMIARAIHAGGDRADKPFVAVSCEGRGELLLESELFGHEKGALMGAAQQTPGKFEIADGGTIFLDDVGVITPRLQADLVRVLQGATFYRLGGSEEVRADVRVVAASGVNLRQAVAEGKFREDLFQNLNAIELRIPPLRERREDIPLLTDHFIERISTELGKEIRGLSGDALKLLMDCDWPGNVRELENAVERAIATCTGRELSVADFSFVEQNQRAARAWPIPAGMTLQEIEKLVIVATLHRTGGNIKEAAGILGIDRSTMYEKIKRYEIPR